MEFLGSLHPKVVHFPIAILILYSVFEIVGIFLKSDFLQKAAHLLLAIGVFAAVGAVLTGNQAAELARTKLTMIDVDNLIENHETYATITLWYYFAVLVLRTYLVLKKKFEGILKYLLIPIVLVGCFFIYEAGEYGGELVYKHGIGTEKINTQSIPKIEVTEDND